MFKKFDFRNKTTRYILQFLILLIGFFLDGLIKQMVPLFNDAFFQVSVQLLLMVLVMMALRDKPVDNHLFWYALILGILYDSYYSHIFGLYTLVFPLTLVLIRSLRNFVPESLIFEGSTYFINLTISLIYLYFVGSFLSLTAVDIAHFVTDCLGPTLLINTILFGIIYYPLSKLLDWLV
ncbi:rod shape-determining protein MreD [Bombilactobacillus folatiphilus]|uniref:Rod shape-determining protein MreD n=1 Tax=Bombilactobacillus folatiphilus TaxID=2923362 RepID=A0ABY4PAA8_9LACO|nr:rod shape-determining protein MreD [Bombilactobacillus folatiphilus]UQS82693.1 rod shape-determining protein MreD [Bombilactobacillus folatiphilus]